MKLKEENIFLIFNYFYEIMKKITFYNKKESLKLSKLRFYFNDEIKF